MKPFSLAGLFGFALLLSGCGDEPPPAPPRPVLTVTVKTLKNDDLGRFAGSIQARYESVLGFRTNGRIASRLFDVGDFVGKGALLATLDPTDQQNQLRASQGDLASAEAQLIDAQANARRQEELFARSVTAQARLDDARTRLKTSRPASARPSGGGRLGPAFPHAPGDRFRRRHHHLARRGRASGQRRPGGGHLAWPEVREAVFDLPSRSPRPAGRHASWSRQLDRPGPPAASLPQRRLDVSGQSSARQRTASTAGVTARGRRLPIISFDGTARSYR